MRFSLCSRKKELRESSGYILRVRLIVYKLQIKKRHRLFERREVFFFTTRQICDLPDQMYECHQYLPHLPPPPSSTPGMS